MTGKADKVEAASPGSPAPEVDQHLIGYFDCFNQERFFEAHEVLEELWLPVRREPAGDFYKGLIQFAGAFVLLQKNRLPPAARLFKLARTNLQKYPSAHQRVDVAGVLDLIETWLSRVERDNFAANPLRSDLPPKLSFQI